LVELGDEKYAIRTSDDEKTDIILPNSEDELIFIQKPYESWGTRYPTPFLIRRGLFRNLKFFSLMSQKGEFIIGRALEYLMIVKKGSERLTLDGRGEYVYSREDLEVVGNDLKELVDRKRNETGAPTYTTNFDTQIEHLIPEYERALKDTLYSPIEKRILAGLGFVDIVEGTSASRRESVLNPKPFIEEINRGIEDFKALLSDLIYAIVEKNAGSHRKWMNAEIRISNPRVKIFLNDKDRQFLRSLYDRGALAKRTLVEIAGDENYDTQVDRRKDEKKKGHEELMYAPVIQNLENTEDEGPTAKKKSDKEQPAAKTSVEKKNFTKSFDSYIAVCKHCEYSGLFIDFINDMTMASEDCVVCPSCEVILKTDEDIVISNKHKKKKLPKAVIKNLNRETLEKLRETDPNFD
jgi:hypothetical protein